MKKSISIILIFIFNLALYSAKHCNCGSFATGIYNYTVAGTDCCNHTPGTHGSYTEYVEDSPGVWSVSQMTLIAGASAQGACCGLG